ARAFAPAGGVRSGRVAAAPRAVRRVPRARVQLAALPSARAGAKIDAVSEWNNDASAARGLEAGTASWGTEAWRSRAVAWLDARLAERGIERTGAVEQPTCGRGRRRCGRRRRTACTG